MSNSTPREKCTNPGCGDSFEGFVTRDNLTYPCGTCLGMGYMPFSEPPPIVTDESRGKAFPEQNLEAQAPNNRALLVDELERIGGREQGIVNHSLFKNVTPEDSPDPVATSPVSEKEGDKEWPKKESTQTGNIPADLNEMTAASSTLATTSNVPMVTAIRNLAKPNHAVVNLDKYDVIPRATSPNPEGKGIKQIIEELCDKACDEICRLKVSYQGDTFPESTAKEITNTLAQSVRDHAVREERTKREVLIAQLKRSVVKLWNAVTEGKFNPRSIVGDETLHMKEILFGDKWPTVDPVIEKLSIAQARAEKAEKDAERLYHHLYIATSLLGIELSREDKPAWRQLASMKEALSLHASLKGNK